MQVKGKVISRIVNTVVSTKDTFMYSDKLKDGGRSVKWPGLILEQAQLDVIKMLVQQTFSNAVVTLRQIQPKMRAKQKVKCDGLRVCVSMHKKEGDLR
jgi:hypothetical protein